jgi:hypothetical protein
VEENLADTEGQASGLTSPWLRFAVPMKKEKSA